MSIFENNDEIGITSFREDADYIFDANKIVVKLVKFNKNKETYLQSDFLGIKTNTFSDVPEFISINIMSQSPKDKRLGQHGYSEKGNVIYECFARYDVNISSKDTVEFVSNYGHDIQSGDKFRIEFKDFGLYRGQFCFKSFELIRI